MAFRKAPPFEGVPDSPEKILLQPQSAAGAARCCTACSAAAPREERPRDPVL